MFVFSRLTADTLKTILEEPYKEKWIMRHNYDYIVILDQGTEDIEDDKKLINLRNALLKWDPTHDNSKKVKFLKGGFEDFNHVCPWETSQRDKNDITSNKEIEPLSDVELDPEPEYKDHKSNRFYKMLMLVYPYLYFFLDVTVQYPSLDSLQNESAKFKLKPTNNNNLYDIKTKLSHIDSFSSEEETDTQELNLTPIERPMFDRSTKVYKLSIN